MVFSGCTSPEYRQTSIGTRLAVKSSKFDPMNAYARDQIAMWKVSMGTTVMWTCAAKNVRHASNNSVTIKLNGLIQTRFAKALHAMRDTMLPLAANRGQSARKMQIFVQGYLPRLRTFPGSINLIVYARNQIAMWMMLMM
jgi:hypothetical protein